MKLIRMKVYEVIYDMGYDGHNTVCIANSYINAVKWISANYPDTKKYKGTYYSFNDYWWLVNSYEFIYIEEVDLYEG